MPYVERDYYEVLGVPQTASGDDIHRAFRASARELHPDVNSDHDAAARFDELSTAYTVLHNPQERARYDRSRLRVRAGRFPQGRQAPAFTRQPRRDVPRFIDERPAIRVSLVIRVRNPFSRLR